jgi:hypothetical protein
MGCAHALKGIHTGRNSSTCLNYLENNGKTYFFDL